MYLPQYSHAQDFGVLPNAGFRVDLRNVVEVCGQLRYKLLEDHVGFGAMS